MASKTVIQGLDPAPQGNQGGFGNYGGGAQNMYSRGAGRPASGTVVSGMMENSGPQGSGQQPQQPLAGGHTPIKSGKPVYGFLYSISRTAAGEYWPLHQGQNTIGSDPSCDIVLSEGTVSSQHAVLMVRPMKKPANVIASIIDARSTNGTMLNGESLAFDAVSCKNGDIITIGDNYELYVVLINAAELGLSVSENFIPMETEDDDFGDINDPTQGGFNPFAGGVYQPGDGTVGLDGSFTGGNHGGTVGM